MAEQGQGRSYACKLCGKSFASGRVLGGHVRSHRATTASKPAKNQRSPLRGHETEFAWSLVNECWVCGKGFRSRRALFGHMRLHPRSERGMDAFVVLPQECDQAFEPQGSLCAHSRSQLEKLRIFNRMDADTPQSSSGTSSEIWRPDEEEAAASLLILSMGAVAYRMKRKDVGHREDGGTKLKKVRYDHTDLGSADNEVHIEMLLRGVEFQNVAEKGDSVYGGGEFEKGFDGALSFKLDGVVTEATEVVKLGQPRSCKTTTFTAGSERSDDSPRKKEYKCKNCSRAFPSHQALGGHCAHPGKRGSSCSAIPNDAEIRGASRGKGIASGKACGGHKSSAHRLVAEEAGGYAAKAKLDIPEKLEISAGLTRLIDLNVPFELQGGGEDGAHPLLKRCLVREHEHGALVGPVV
ncbi:zinc finger protein 879-like [Rhodamnia argentea]|uniref:Zinc finger protein 879-like n=1 Tax=Rhodamnia argentea TaxID=178133 RepID=A0A8B8MUP4_9MYRT|nr:zinc finger protein 879-like [Rhodamnia argentea]